MTRFVLKRILLMILVLFGVLLFIFILSRASGDPVPSLLGSDYTQEQYDEMYLKLGLDKPYVVQFFDYLVGVVTRLDLGTSYQSKRAVSYEVFTRFPLSLKMSLIAMAWSIPLGLFFGIMSAIKQYSALDYIVRTASMILAAAPGFWVALMLMLLFSLKLKWVPATGLSSWKCYILPAITQGAHTVGSLTRMTRSTMLDVIRQDYIRTARSKGLNERKVMLGHAFQNAAIPIVTQIGATLARAFAGSAIVENIFGIPGTGSFLINSIGTHDYPAVQGVVFAYSFFVCVINLLIDLTYGFLDPRIKAKYESADAGAKRAARSFEKAQKEAA